MAATFNIPSGVVAPQLDDGPTPTTTKPHQRPAVFRARLRELHGRPWLSPALRLACDAFAEAGDDARDRLYASFRGRVSPAVFRQADALLERAGLESRSQLDLFGER